MGEMRNRLDEMLADRTARPMVKPLTGYSSERIEYFKHLAEVELPRFLDAAFHQVDWQRYKVVGFTKPSVSLCPRSLLLRESRRLILR